MRAGFYETEITPPLGCGIPGYFHLRISTGVKRKLYAKAAVLENDGTYVAFVAIDSVCVPLNADKIIKERVAKSTPIEPSAIVIAAIHCHTAGPVKANRRMFDNEDEVEINKIIERTAFSAADAITLAYQRMQEVDAYFAEGSVDGVSFIRQYNLSDGTIRTNPSAYKPLIIGHCGEPDKKLPIILFKNSEGKPVGSITSFALHHDTVGGTEYSSDYSGAVAENLKKVYGEDFVSVFYQGFAGDINHLDYCRKDPPHGVKTEKIAEAITEEFLRVVETAEKQDEVLNVCRKYAMVTKRKIDPQLVERAKFLFDNPPKDMVGSISDPTSDAQIYARSKSIVAKYILDPRTEMEIPVQVVRIGQVAIFAWVGEPFCHYAFKIREGSPTDKNMMISVAHQIVGYSYIPTPDMFLPSVYESSETDFEPDAGDVLVEKTLETAKLIF